MSRRFAITSFIVISSILIGFFLFVLTLFLLPGVRMLGVKYIALDTHRWNTGKVFVSEQLKTDGTKVGTYSGIILNTYEIPVEIVFTGEHDSVKVEYVDNYNGVTSSKIKNPSITFEKDTDGNAIINVDEYHTFIYESGTSVRYVKLHIPLSSTATGSKFNLMINSNHSKVRFCFDSDYGTYIKPATFNNLTINTNGDVTYDYNVRAINFTYTTSQSIEIDESINDKSKENAIPTIEATNYNLKSTNGKIVVKTPVSGTLEAHTTLGKVLLHSCNKLIASTTFGDVGYSGTDGGKVNVSGSVDISTKAGNVKLGDVSGQGIENKISTTSGNITINKINDGTIRTQRGQVNINSVNKFDILSTTGKITVQEAKTSIKAQSTRGKITLGGGNMLMNNMDVDSILGTVTVLSATGTVNINTISADVNFTNYQSKNIEIVCGGKFIGEKLKGDVKITVEEAVERMMFDSVNEGNTEISLSDKCKNAFIEIKSLDLEEITYYVTGKTIEIKEWKDFAWQEHSGVKQDVFDQPSSTSPYSFTLGSKNAQIILGFRVD